MWRAGARYYPFGSTGDSGDRGGVLHGCAEETGLVFPSSQKDEAIERDRLRMIRNT